MPLNTTTSPPSRPHWPELGGLLLVLFLACLVGILSRPIGYLATFWPANAVMLGMLLRSPHLARMPLTWGGMLATYFMADWLMGSSWWVSLSLNLANLIGIGCGWLYLYRQRSDVLQLQHQRSVLIIFTGCLLAAASGALAGAWPSHLAFGVPLWRAATMWLCSEFYNFILVLPLMLSAPARWPWHWQRPVAPPALRVGLPLLALALSEALSLVIGGPGAIAFIMPAMMWCAMSLGVFPMAVLNLVVCIWKMASISFGNFSFLPEHVMEVASFRTGLALLSVAPLAVACAYSLRLQAMEKLHHAVNHDFLTGVLARRALLERGNKLISRLQAEGQPLAVLMLDIDHFKQVNDRYGHAQGDAVLQTFARLAREALRPDDLLGRVGGEEFAIILPRTQRQQALGVAQRICECLRQHHFALPDNAQMQVTLSVGLHAVSVLGTHDSVEHLLSKADHALYAAKHHGRNQVRQFGPALAPSTL